MKLDDVIILACPNCKESLINAGVNYFCQPCDTTYPVEDGMIDLRANRLDYFFNPVSANDMENIINNLHKDNWVDSVKRFIEHVSGKRPSSWIDNLVINSRYSWKVLLDLDKNRQLLDIGCGLGNLVSNLAPHVKKAYAMDLTYIRLKFAQKRIATFNPSDDVTFVVGGDGKFLPFPDKSFDCVTVSGVLEWVGVGDSSPYQKGTKIERLQKMLSSYFGENNPREIQLSFLKEIKRILKDDGQLFIGIENRLNYEYFTGRPDHHSNLLYGSLLPRFIANIYSIIKKKVPYRTYTYCIPGYKKLLYEAGFKDLEFFGLTDGYSFLNGMHTAENNDKNWRSKKRNNLKETIKFNKYFVPAYGIIASVGEKHKNRLQDSIFSEIKNKITQEASSDLIVNDYLITKKEKLVIKATISNKRIIIKIPVNSEAIKSEETNKNILENIYQLNISPVFIAKVEASNLIGYVEEQLGGSSLSATFGDYSVNEVYELISKTIHEKNPIGQFDTIEFNGLFYEQLVEEPLNDLFEQIKDSELHTKLKQFFKDALYDKSVAAGITHGDMSVSNIYIENKSIKLIDWEAGYLYGLPILDVINYLGSECRHKSSDLSMYSTIEMLTSKDFLDTAGGLFLKDQYKYFGMSIDIHTALVYLNWLHNVSCLIRFSLKYNQININQFIYDVVKHIK